MKLKKCWKCKKEKSLALFHKNKRNKDGRHCSCIECRITQSKTYAAKYRKVLCQRKKEQYKNNPELLKKLRLNSKTNYERNNPEKVAARNIFKAAVKAGRLKKAPCILCKNKKSEGHHIDYSKPLDVIWLCRPHHRAWHRLFTEGI